MREFKRFCSQLLWIPVFKWAGRKGQVYVIRQRRRLKRSRFLSVMRIRRHSRRSFLHRRKRGWRRFLP